MSRGAHKFRFTEVGRLIRAAQEAGFKPRGLTLAGDTVTVLLDGPVAAIGGDNPNPWDQVLSDDSDKKRPA